MMLCVFIIRVDLPSFVTSGSGLGSILSLFSRIINTKTVVWCIVIVIASDSFPVSISIPLPMGVTRLFLNGFEPQGYDRPCFVLWLKWAPAQSASNHRIFDAIESVFFHWIYCESFYIDLNWGCIALHWTPIRAGAALHCVKLLKPRRLVVSRLFLNGRVRFWLYFDFLQGFKNSRTPIQAQQWAQLPPSWSRIKRKRYRELIPVLIIVLESNYIHFWQTFYHFFTARAQPDPSNKTISQAPHKNDSTDYLTAQLSIHRPPARASICHGQESQESTRESKPSSNNGLLIKVSRVQVTCNPTGTMTIKAHCLWYLIDTAAAFVLEMQRWHRTTLS
jgi:hypothetical protein